MEPPIQDMNVEINIQATDTFLLDTNDRNLPIVGKGTMPIVNESIVPVLIIGRLGMDMILGNWRKILLYSLFVKDLGSIDHQLNLHWRQKIDSDIRKERHVHRISLKITQT